MVTKTRLKNKLPRGELVENRIILWNIQESRTIFSMGFYGKPIGVPKPKGNDFDAPLVLDLIEGYYLVIKGILKVYNPLNQKSVALRRIGEICEEQYVDFSEKFLVYTKLRDSGLIVTPGIKFGCDFAIYEKGPGIDHAPYLIQVVKTSDKLTATGIVLAGRLATTVRKQFTIALANTEENNVSFLSFDWWRA